MKSGLSIVLAVYNEEQNIRRCLESVLSISSEIIVVDGNSTDKTVEIAKSFGCKIIKTDNRPNFHINKNIGIKAASFKWILQLDADECLSENLSQEIMQITTSNSALAGYWIPRKNYFLGRFLTKGGQYPDYTLRLYQNGLGNLPAVHVHEQAQVNGPVGFLKHDLLHYGTPDFSNYLIRFNRYTSLTAESLIKNGLKFNLLSLVNFIFIKPTYTFLNIYLRHKGIVDGFPGFIFALYSGLHFPIAYIKFWQKKYYPDHD